MQPLISIITVSYNCSDFLERTILSILNQTFLNYEFIIIDGYSQDNSIDILNKYNDRIDYWISEPDKGIYDAMNKGIRLATGSWIIFMNSGDEFCSSLVLESIFENNISDEIEVIYGDAIAHDESNSMMILKRAKKMKHCWKSMPFSHQSCFVRLTLLRKIQFNVNFLICADYLLILNLYQDGYKFLYLPLPISKSDIGGLSYSNPHTAWETRKAYLMNDVTAIGRCYHIIAVIEAIVRHKIMSILGVKFTSRIRSIKWKLVQFLDKLVSIRLGIY